MIRHRAVFHFRVVLAVAVICLTSPSKADDVCIWCDPGMSKVFLDCIYTTIQQSQQFGNLPLNSMDDMENSMIAASGAITKSSEAMKMSMMNGAMAGELAELIKAQSGPQDPKALTKSLLDIVGNCYVQVSGQPHQKFTGLLGNTVNSMLSVNDNSAGPLNSPQLSSPTPISGQNTNPSLLYSNNAAVANQANFNLASQNYQLAYQPNFQSQQVNSQSNAQTFLVNKQLNVPQQPNPNGGFYPFNQQKQGLFYAPSSGGQPINGPGIMNYNQPYPSNNQLTVSKRFTRPDGFSLNRQNIPQSQFQNVKTDWGVLNQGNVYPNNRAPISGIQTDKNIAAAPARPDLISTIPVVENISPSSTPTSPPVIVDILENAEPTTQSAAPPKKPKKSRKPKRPRVRVTPATNVQVMPNKSDDDVENAIKFAETIYFILTKSNMFTGILNKDLSKDDAMSITFNAVQNALNDCGYSNYSLEIANACGVAVAALPQQCASEVYAEQLAKTLMTQFFKKGLVRYNPVDQGKSFAIAMLKKLKQVVPGTATLPSLDSTDPSTESVATAKSTDALVTTQASVPTDSPSGRLTNPNVQFYNVLYAFLSKSWYFNTLFTKDATKSDAVSWLIQMLTNLYADYGKQITVAAASECTKRIATVPDSYANIISNCVTDVFADSGLISAISPADQAKNIASKFNISLIKIINKTTGEADNSPMGIPQVQNTGNSPIDSSMLQNFNNGQNTQQNVQNIPDLNKQPSSTNIGDYNYPFGNKYLILQRNQQNPQLLQQQPFPVKNMYPIYNDEQTPLDSPGSLLVTKQTNTELKRKKNLIKKPVTPIINTDLNAAALISKQNNDYPSVLDEKRIPIDNTPEAQIFPDRSSDESKQRIQILMKWAISSIQNGKFNYKVFSSVISALAKFIQKSNPELGAQKALFKVLLESIVALTQLLIQVPPNNFSLQNVPNSNVPPLQNENVTPLQNENVTPLQNENVTPLQNVNVRSLQDADVPPLQNANIPPLDGADVLPLQNANVPSLQNANVPPLQNANVPPLQNANVPPLQNVNVPTLQNVNIPPLQNTNVLPLQNDNISPLQNANAPSLQNSNVSPLQNVNAPPLQNANAPNLQNLNNVPIFQNGQNANAPSINGLPDQISVVQSNQNYPGVQLNNYNNGQYFDAQQQQTATNWNSGYVFQQGPAPGFLGQNNFQASQPASGIPDNNGNWNRPQLDAQNNWASSPQEGLNGQYLPQNVNQQNDGSFLNGNPNQNAFSQGNGMQAGYQGNW